MKFNKLQKYYKLTYISLDNRIFIIILNSVMYFDVSNNQWIRHWKINDLKYIKGLPECTCEKISFKEASLYFL